MIKFEDILQRFTPSLTWNIPVDDKRIFLTFDDGPVPEATAWVLDELNKFQVKATFFCVGENVRRNPDLYERIIIEGHSVGNHTQHHMNGWKTEKTKYLNDVKECSKFIKSGIFRPPYGRLKLNQIKELKKKYSIIMWDVLSMDYDHRLSPENCIERVKRRTKPGSIVVFHDSAKAMPRLKKSLPVLLSYFINEGFTPDLINMNYGRKARLE
ncbi:MAG: polysaccharide deacetylase family protein [Bacteroidetes bacterium]|nr:MAG: polysaccharide deacetylase family protein [Bacteroidota bacterium]REK36269.1 MAG: polysaccharide deacetylase family protein [Bacteroidota bacterium]REK51067.1 MAG: polysaccharide deacetylase family protein [Bacteroidota bacterium]